MTALNTERFAMRPLTLADLEELHQLWTSAGVRRFLWDDQVFPPSQTRDILEENTRRFADLGHGIWGVREKDHQALWGFCGYWEFHDPPQLEWLIGIHENHWGKGLGQEVGRAVLDYGHQRLGFTSIRASTDLENTACVRLMERLGMSFSRRGLSSGLETLYYEHRHSQ